MVQNALLKKAAGQLMGRSVSSHSRIGKEEYIISARGREQNSLVAVPGVVQRRLLISLTVPHGATVDMDAPFLVRDIRKSTLIC